MLTYIASPPAGKVTIIPQIIQADGQLAAFGLFSGMCFAFADIFPQQAMPLLGIVTAAAISDALRTPVLTGWMMS